MKKKSILNLMLGFLFVSVIALSSCNKGCYTCTSGDWEDYEICNSDGYGNLAIKQFKQNCRAGGGRVAAK
ncbi:MAG: hypothetical protein ACPGVH_03890 [Chitinophagales bacterium]